MISKYPCRADRSGSVLVIFLLVLPILILIVGFSIDYAHWQRVRTELRRTTDLSAKAAAATLSATDNLSEARAAARMIAENNSVNGVALELPNDSIIFGHSEQQSDGSWDFQEGETPTNAVKIIGSKTSMVNEPVSNYFGFLYGNPSFETEITAVAAFIDSDICLVLDRSSSMKLAVSSLDPLMSVSDPRFCDVPWSDSRWVALDEAVEVFITEMERSIAREQISIVTFASDFNHCDTFAPKVSVDQELTLDNLYVRDAMSELRNSVWGGRTDIAAGIETGHSVLYGPESRSTAQKFLIVFTDGEYTEDNPVPMAASAARDDIIIFTVTFGDGANQATMHAVSRVGKGRHFHADNAAELRSVFREISGAITNLIQ